MPYINVDVDLDDVLWELSSKEKQELVDDLYDDGYVPKQVTDYENPKNDFDTACMKLFGQAWRLTKEEEEFIINISKRF